ncbi:hypothetical protein [Luteibacter sp. SG786]|uniref:hypothetical protein n=1 Tax=Luteibacter sp. SG786 TaxID=2587130 RepID=UPI001420E748|nr:hypothetical protein [Luteibacter sp. SG786]NII56177.1 hypothetical protein [Luteibacter sp. SG786]
MSRFEDIICEAIRSMHLLTVEYGGEERLVQPYVYGDDHAGNRLLSAYQVAGGSASGASAGWKFFRMDKVTSVASSDRRFHSPRPEFQRDDGAFARILCQVGD